MIFPDKTDTLKEPEISSKNELATFGHARIENNDATYNNYRSVYQKGSI